MVKHCAANVIIKNMEELMQIEENTYNKMPPEIKALFIKDSNPEKKEVKACFPESKGDKRTSKPTYNKGHWGNSKSVISNALYSDSG